MSQQFTVAVCDDDTTIFTTLQAAAAQAFAQNGAQAQVRCFATSAALQAAMAETDFDLVLLDIEMPEGDGIRFGERLSHMERAPDVIFVSSREDRVFDAFRIHPFGFVRKSCFLKDIGAVIADYVAERQDDSARVFAVHTAGGTVSIPVDSIVYFEGDRKNQLVHSTRFPEPVVIAMSMKQLEELFAPRAFLRVHAGFLVNYRYIHRLGSDEAVLTDGSVVPVSRRKAALIKLAYMELLKKEGLRIY